MSAKQDFVNSMRAFQMKRPLNSFVDNKMSNLPTFVVVLSALEATAVGEDNPY